MLALGAPLLIVFAVLLLFGAAVIVLRTFTLVRHAKSLVASTKEAAGRLNDAAEDIQSQVRMMEETAGDLKATRDARASKRGGRV